MKAFYKTSSLAVVVLSALIMFTTGCKKDKANSVGASCKLISVQNHTTDTALITYDSQGRVATYGSLAFGLYTFSYSGLTATADVTITDTSYHHRMNLFLNTAGRVESMTENLPIGSGTYRYNFTFRYDTDDHIIWSEQTVRRLGSSNTDYYKDSLIYSDGNLVKKYSFSKFNSDPYVLFEHREYTYTTDLNKAGYHISDNGIEPISITSGWAAYYHLFGNTSKNLPARANIYDNAGVLSAIVDYTFLLNTQGYPVDENFTRSLSYPGVSNRKFTYTCD